MRGVMFASALPPLPTPQQRSVVVVNSGVCRPPTAQNTAERRFIIARRPYKALFPPTAASVMALPFAVQGEGPIP